MMGIAGVRKWCVAGLGVLGMLLLSAAASAAPAAKIEQIVVKTKAPKNPEVTFHCRIPRTYRSADRLEYRILVYFGGRNTSGAGEAQGGAGWAEWADRNKIFIVAPGFKDDNYWEPEEWAGPALLKALSMLKSKYRVCTTKLLFYGFSGGSQCSNLFPAWKPAMTRAWVSHAGGVFHTPSTRMRGVPGLVTCGDADIQRYIISRRFVENARAKGENIIWKSYPNLNHSVPMESYRLAREFLGFYHRRHLEDLGGSKTGRAAEAPPVWIGDDQDQLFYPVKSAQAANIPLEDRVLLPSNEIALAWGKPAPVRK